MRTRFLYLLRYTKDAVRFPRRGPDSYQQSISHEVVCWVKALRRGKKIKTKKASEAVKSSEGLTGLLAFCSVRVRLLSASCRESLSICISATIHILTGTLLRQENNKKPLRSKTKNFLRRFRAKQNDVHCTVRMTSGISLFFFRDFLTLHWIRNLSGWLRLASRALDFSRGWARLFFKGLFWFKYWGEIVQSTLKIKIYPGR